jgi:hypothetical protein
MKLLDVPARFGDEPAGKKVAIAVDDTGNRRGVDGVLHGLANRNGLWTKNPGLCADARSF